MVNKPWRNHSAIGVDGMSGRVMALAHPDNLAMVHRHIGVKSRLTRAIYHTSVLNE
jgi:hypothetical protein